MSSTFAKKRSGSFAGYYLSFLHGSLLICVFQLMFCDKQACPDPPDCKASHNVDYPDVAAIKHGRNRLPR